MTGEPGTTAARPDNRCEDGATAAAAVVVGRPGNGGKAVRGTKSGLTAKGGNAAVLLFAPAADDTSPGTSTGAGAGAGPGDARFTLATEDEGARGNTTGPGGAATAIDPNRRNFNPARPGGASAS